MDIRTPELPAGGFASPQTPSPQLSDIWADERPEKCDAVVGDAPHAWLEAPCLPGQMPAADLHNGHERQAPLTSLKLSAVTISLFPLPLDHDATLSRQRAWRSR